MPKPKKKIKVDSTLRSRIKATRKPPSRTEGLVEAYKNKRSKADSLQRQNDSLKAANDSLQRVIIELKAKQNEKVHYI